MQEEDLISVIVPIYKVEKYLRKCVDSILSQTYTNLEIILVDDGSPDDCPKICDEYSQKDKRIKVIHKKNGGLSSARNIALDSMNGEYVTFIDSDDYAESSYIEELYKVLNKNGCDIAACNYNNITEQGDVVAGKRYISYGFVKKEDVFDAYFEKKLISDTAWGKLYKKELFLAIRYPEGLNYEDTYVILDLLKSVEKGIVTIDKPLYNYLIREGSITMQDSKNQYDSIIACRDILAKFDVGFKYYPNLCSRLFWQYGKLYKKHKGSDKNCLQDFEQMLKSDWKKYGKHLRFKSKLRWSLFRHFRGIYNLLF